MTIARLSCVHNDSSKTPQGQSLVEFVMVMPMILLLLLGAFAVGQGMYQGASASLAVKAAMNQKATLANQPGQTLTQASNLIRGAVHGNLDNGSAVDTVVPDAASTNTLTTVLIANRRFTPPVPFLPPVDFTVTQGVPTRLISANTTVTTPDIITVLGYPAPPAPPALPTPPPVVRSNVPVATPVSCADPAAPATLSAAGPLGQPSYAASLQQNYGGNAVPCPAGVAGSSKTISPAGTIQY
jgi:Flp pilus assembly protein TadG